MFIVGVYSEDYAHGVHTAPLHPLVVIACLLATPLLAGETRNTVTSRYGCMLIIVRTSLQSYLQVPNIQGFNLIYNVTCMYLECFATT